MYLSIIDVKAKDNYQLLLTFSNGEKRQFDVKPYLELGIFQDLKDPALFASVKPSFDSVEWPNDADIDPEVLYKNSIKVD